jgi:SPP1 gp7 family putative phage head morphogenesis protein
VTAPVADQLGYQYEQQPDTDPTTEILIAALVAYFASSAAIKASVLPAKLVDQLVSAGYNVRAVRAAGRMALSVSMSGRSRYGAPTVPDRSTWTGPGSPPTPSMARRVAADEPRMRARYVVNAAKRLTGALVDGRFLPALTQERSYLTAHVQAGQKRKVAAQALDAVAAKHGLLVWHTVMDDRTTEDCATLDGKLFTIENPPGLPGAMHPNCRCEALPATV